MFQGLVHSIVRPRYQHRCTTTRTLLHFGARAFFFLKLENPFLGVEEGVACHTEVGLACLCLKHGHLWSKRDYKICRLPRQPNHLAQT